MRCSNRRILKIVFLRDHPTSGWWPLPRGPLWCDYVAASGGWPPARGYLHSESVNAQRMRPYMPGGRWRGGPYKRGLLYVRKCERVDMLLLFLRIYTYESVKGLICCCCFYVYIRTKV